MKDKIFILEFRNEKGAYMFELKDTQAEKWFEFLKSCPELKHCTRNIEGKGEFVVLECIKKCGYTLSGLISFILQPGAYIKAYYESVDQHTQIC